MSLVDKESKKYVTRTKELLKKESNSKAAFVKRKKRKKEIYAKCEIFQLVRANGNLKSTKRYRARE